jgi:hypothetical protein
MPEPGCEVHVCAYRKSDSAVFTNVHCYIALKSSTISVRQGQLESSLYFEGPVAQESVVDSALLRSNFQALQTRRFQKTPLKQIPQKLVVHIVVVLDLGSLHKSSQHTRTAIR